MMNMVKMAWNIDMISVRVKRREEKREHEDAHPCALGGRLTRTPEQLSPEKIPIILQEGQVKIPEKFHMLVFYSQLFRGIPVNHLDLANINRALHLMRSTQHYTCTYNEDAALLPLHQDYNSTSIF